jgi:uncharacterized protein YprB with RNaseH-like and TPR domain
MSELGARLANLRRLIAEREQREWPARGIRPERLFESVPIESVLPGEVRQAGTGSFFVREVSYPASHRHGSLPLSAALTYGPSAHSLLVSGGATESSALAPASAVFIDTETTGLTTGTGTLAFLIGVGFFVADRFTIRQYFVPGFAAEEGCLAALASDLAPFSSLVTFNGGSFDVPLLEARYIASRLRPPFGRLAHVDLLPAARRLFRRRVGSCRLADLEASVLGFGRHGDVPGEMIPRLYLEYLRSGDARPLAVVFRHNERDLLSMAALLGALQVTTSECLRGSGHAADLLSVARACEGRARLEQCRGLYERALSLGLAASCAGYARRRLSIVYRRLGHHELAYRLWREMARTSGDSSSFAHVELAKYLEHRSRDPLAAREVVLRALANRVGRRHPPCRDEDALRRRLARLEGKLARAKEGTAGSPGDGGKTPGVPA